MGCNGSATAARGFGQPLTSDHVTAQESDYVKLGESVHGTTEKHHIYQKTLCVGNVHIDLDTSLIDEQSNISTFWVPKLFIYYVVGLGVQALMSWDGGATQNVTNALDRIGWEPWEIGLLVGIDRFPGVVLSAGFWGYALNKFRAKPLLLLAVIAKAISCGLFGVLDPATNQFFMLTARCSMGVWEALFGVWLISWIGRYSHGNVSWNNNVGMFAGVGSGLGGLVAGSLSTIGGNCFRWVFVIQAVLLSTIFLSVCLLSAFGCLPADTMEFRTDETNFEMQGSISSTHNNETLLYEVASSFGSGSTLALSPRDSYCNQVKFVVGRPLWLYTCCAFSCCMFTQSGIMVLWQNTATKVWSFDVFLASVTLVVMGALGGFVGMQFGDKQMTRNLALYGLSMESHPRMKSPIILNYLQRWTLVAALCGTLAAIALAVKTRWLVHFNIKQDEWDVILCILVLSVVVMNFIIGAVQGFLQQENCNSAPGELEGVANSLQLLCQNLVGFGAGAFVPAVLVQLFGRWASRWPDMNEDALDGAQYSFGLSCVFLSAWLLFFWTASASRCHT